MAKPKNPFIKRSSSRDPFVWAAKVGLIRLAEKLEITSHVCSTSSKGHRIDHSATCKLNVEFRRLSGQ
ncbi:MAG: hypothetical protein NTW21_39810 [Verrucomicrobia bacterium]|nr:hypothetical protein [Verrucomicrobiota bacterium]